MGFKPPKLGATMLISPKLPAPEEALDNALFNPGMLLHDRPLNFYISVNVEPKPFLINAGYLLAHFAFSEKVGYRELKRLLSSKVQAEEQDLQEEVVEAT